MSFNIYFLFMELLFGETTLLLMWYCLNIYYKYKTWILGPILFILGVFLPQAPINLRRCNRPFQSKQSRVKEQTKLEFKWIHIPTYLYPHTLVVKALFPRCAKKISRLTCNVSDVRNRWKHFSTWRRDCYSCYRQLNEKY